MELQDQLQLANQFLEYFDAEYVYITQSINGRRDQEFICSYILFYNGNDAIMHNDQILGGNGYTIKTAIINAIALKEQCTSEKAEAIFNQFNLKQERA